MATLRRFREWLKSDEPCTPKQTVAVLAAFFVAYFGIVATIVAIRT